MDLDTFIAEWNNPSDRVLVHTSGSTGKPKPMMVEKRRMACSARITCRFLGLQRGDTALLCMPLDYIAGKMVVVRSLVAGLKLIAVPPSGHPLATVSQHINFAAMVPLQVVNSLQDPQERARLEAIDHLIIGGGAIDDSLARELKQFPRAVWSTYGMTETLSHIALRRLSGPQASQWYTPFESVTVGLDSRGCLTIDAPQVCPAPLTTNDRAIVENGRFKILGRIDNVIDTGGIKVQIEEVEHLLKPHLKAPFIISKKKDARLGEMIVLLTQDPDTAAVEAACRVAIANRYWRPRRVVHIDKLPLTATGKPARAQAERYCNTL